MSSFFIMVAGCVNGQVSVKLLLQPYRDAALGEEFLALARHTREAARYSGREQAMRQNRTACDARSGLRWSTALTLVCAMAGRADRDRRYFWLVSRVGSDSGEVYPETDDIKFDYDNATDGVYKLTLKNSLTPGKYALVSPGERHGYQIYDFAVDGF